MIILCSFLWRNSTGSTRIYPEGGDSWPPSYITSCLHIQPSYLVSFASTHPVTSSGVIPVQGRLRHSTQESSSGSHMSPGEEAALTGLQGRVTLALLPLDHPTHPAHFCLRPFLPVLSAETAVTPEIHSAFPPSFL